MGCYTKVFVIFETAFWREAGSSGEAYSLVNTHSYPPLSPAVSLSYRLSLIPPSLISLLPYSSLSSFPLSLYLPPSLKQTPSTQYPVASTYDAVSHSGKQCALCCFIVADLALHFGTLSKDEQKRAVLNSLLHFFNSNNSIYLKNVIENPLDFFVQEWSKETFTKGCPVNVFPPGTFGRFSEVLRTPLWHNTLQFAATETAKQWTGYMDGAVESGYRAANGVLAQANFNQSSNNNNNNTKVLLQSGDNGSNKTSKEIEEKEDLIHHEKGDNADGTMTYGWVNCKGQGSFANVSRRNHGMSAFSFGSSCLLVATTAALTYYFTTHKINVKLF
jgi:hypothetical protein